MPTADHQETVERVKKLLASEGLQNLKCEVRQSSDQTGEYYLTHAQITAGGRIIIDLGPNPVDEGGDWSSSTLELFCEAVNILPALLSRLQAVEEENAWRPIETAPRDGTDVLLWAPHWKSPATGWTFARDAWQGCRKDTHINPPTHWRPLPAPPAGATPGEGL